jgi:WD40 repeat protein
VDFHPSHDRYFVSGCFDRRLRLWDIIPDGNVISWGFANEVITAVCFDPNGILSIVTISIYI